jgi:hypothetical protein
MNEALDAAAIIAEGETVTGIIDPEPELRINLDMLVASLNRDGRFSAAGLATTRQGLVRVTKDRLEAHKWLRDFPEIGEEVIADPVFLCGLPRSGTTYFQYLFDNDRRFRLIRTWEAVMPFPPPGHDPASVTARKAMERQVNQELRNKVDNFDALHLIDEDGPQECHMFLEHGYGAAGFFNLYDCPDYFDFLMDELDFEPVYRAHNRMLQLLQWQCPSPRWALKYPNHILAMEPIRKVFPGARFVMTHRDPAQILASICKMTFSLRSAREAAPVDPNRVGRQMLHFIRCHIDRIMQFCTGPEAASVHHVDYYRLAADPIAMLDDIHAGIGADTPGDVRTSIAQWRAANPQGKRGENRYSLEQFGLDESEVRTAFADYIAHFAIPSEADGIRQFS